jgi:predicted Na+-dependent transporter
MRRVDDRLIAGWLLAITIAAGYFVPVLSKIFAPHALPALFIMILASLIPMARLKLEEIFSLEADILRIVFWQLFVLPTIILAATHLLKIDRGLVTLMAVTACAGSLFASPALANLLGLNQRKALQCMVLSTFIMPFSYFIFLTLVLHSELEIEISEFVGRTGLYLMLPAGLFLLYSAFAEDMRDETAHKIETGARWVTIVALMVFGLGIVGPAAKLLATDPVRFLIYLVIVTALGAGMAFLTTIVMYRQGITNALTASIVSGFRNVGLGFVLIQGSADQTTAAYVGVSQVPIFLAPLIMRLFIDGRVDEESETAEANSPAASPAAGKPAFATA